MSVKNSIKLFKSHLRHLPIKRLSFTSLSANFTSLRNFSLSTANKMKVVQFTYNDDSSKKLHVGYLMGDNVVDVSKADCSLPTTLIDILRDQEELEKLKRLVCQCIKPPTVPSSSITLAPPITGMDKVLCIGLNYADHCKEQNLTPPPVPMIFSKFASSVIGPSDTLKLRTNVTKKVDWEVELVVVIGKTASNVKASDAYDYIFGYTIAQDISARDWQKELNGGQFLLGKSQDGFCPIGPCITTHDEIIDPTNLDISCTINGELKQSSNTCQLIHKIPDVIERLSSVMTLLPGDIILTGTPGGVGMHRNPPEFLKPGDLIRSDIDKIGTFSIKVEEF